MNQKFIKSTLLSGLILGTLTMSNISANATGFHTGINNVGKVISSEQFYDMVNKAEAPSDIAKQFGRPDQIATLTDAKGAQEGVIWVYENAVAKQSAKLNANFVFVAGEFKYVTLSADS